MNHYSKYFFQSYLQRPKQQPSSSENGIAGCLISQNAKIDHIPKRIYLFFKSIQPLIKLWEKVDKHNAWLR